MLADIQSQNVIVEEIYRHSQMKPEVEVKIPFKVYVDDSRLLYVFVIKNNISGFKTHIFFSHF